MKLRPSMASTRSGVDLRRMKVAPTRPMSTSSSMMIVSSISDLRRDIMYSPG